MANICWDDVYFFSDEHPERIQGLWEDLETAIILCSHTPEDCWIGNLLNYKKISTKNLSLRGSVCYMEYDDASVLLSLEAYWSPLYEAYQQIADAYGVSFVMKSVEPGNSIYYNTDNEGRYFCERYCIHIIDESLIPQNISNVLEDEAPFESAHSILEKFKAFGYSADSLSDLEAQLENIGIEIHKFKNPYQ